MQYLKNKSIIYLLVLVFSFSCSNEKKKANNEQKSRSEAIEAKLKKYNCVEEYSNARYYYYCKFYNVYTNYFRCNYTNLYDSIPISFLNIALSDYSFNNIELENDSIIKLSFDSYLNDSCVCAEPPHESCYSPGSITVNVKTKLVEQDLGRTTAHLIQTKEEHEAILNNPKIKDFIRMNETKINKWFLEEYKKRNSN